MSMFAADKLEGKNRIDSGNWAPVWFNKAKEARELNCYESRFYTLIDTI